jgi:hypothetical protein
MRPSHGRSLLVAVMVAGALHPGCIIGGTGGAPGAADRPWAPSALEGLRVEQLEVHVHQVIDRYDYYDIPETDTHGLALLAYGTVVPFEVFDDVVSSEPRPRGPFPARVLVGGDCAVFADQSARCIDRGRWRVIATDVIDYVPPTRFSSGERGLIECVVTIAGAVLCRDIVESGTPFTGGTTLPAGGHTFVSVDVDLAAICAVTDTGSVRCWDYFGSSGRDVPLDGIVDITIAQLHACVLIDDGSARCWGENSEGELGSGGNALSLDFETVSDFTNVVEIAAGGRHTCARREGGEVLCWGATGLLAELEPAERATPHVVPDVEGAVDISTSRIVDCAAIDAGGAKCWGTSDPEVTTGMARIGFFIPDP